MNSINKEIKRNSYTIIFKLIQENSKVSRRELESLSKLSWGTVSAVTADLTKYGLIKGFKDTSLSLGRTPDKLTINDNIYFLGIDINIIGLTFVVTDLGYRIHESVFVDLKSNEKDEIINLLFSNTKSLVEKYNPLSISLSMQGQIDKEKGISRNIEHFNNWDNIDIISLFENKFKTKTYLYHDPDCLLTYHKKVNKIKIEEKLNVLLIKLDDGIGMSIMLDKNIFESNNGIVSEIGHTCVDINGRKCKCGKNGCLESYFSLDSLTALYNEKEKRNISSRDFVIMLENKNEKAISIIKENSLYLGMAISNILNVMGSELLIIDGTMSKYSKYYIKELDDYLKTNTKNNYEILVANYNRNSTALGAAMKTINENITDIIFNIVKE